MSIRILIGILSASVVLLGILLAPSSSIRIQAAGVSETMVMPTPELAKPLFTDYRGVTIGMTAVDTREKLGKAKDTSDAQDFYVFSEGETVQIVYDDDKTVKAISATYMGPKVTPPAPKDLFGVDADAKPDGSINKMVKYPKASIWISYIKTGGDDPMVMVTVSKLQKGES